MGRKPAWATPQLVLAVLAIGCSSKAVVPPARPNSAAQRQPTAAAEDDGPRTLVERREVVPSQLEVLVEAGPIGGGVEQDGWVFRSRGFAALGQPELVLVVAHAEGVDARSYPQDVLELYQALFETAAAGSVLEPWIIVGAPGGLVGRRDLTGVLIVPGGFGSSSSSDNTLIVITEAELQLAKVAGAARIANMLGRSHRFFPMPYWLDPERESVVTDGAETLLSRVHCSFLPGMSAVLDVDLTRASTEIDPETELAERTGTIGNSRLRLRLSKRAGRQLAQIQREVPRDQVVAVLVAPDPDVPARLVWTLASRMEVITADPGGQASSVAGNFVVFLPDGGDEVGGAVVEDGFGIILTSEQHAAAITALEQGLPFSLQGQGDNISVVLEWTD